MSSENKLADEILATIEGMLERPEMYGATADAIEGQFFTLFTLVAPYRFGMTSEEAAERLRAFACGLTGGSAGISSVHTDVKDCARIIKAFYIPYTSPKLLRAASRESN